MRTFLAICLGFVMFTACKSDIDLDTLKEEMMQRDREFSARSVETNTSQAFFEYLAEEGIAFSFDPPLIGNEKIAANMPADSTYVLSWEPDFAEISEKGDMGYTSGIYNVKQTGMDGDIHEGKGRYLTVWQKIDDVWMVIADIGTSPK